jgi:hypothetical protein
MDKIVLYAFDQAREKLKADGGFDPFTVIVHNNDLYVENHPGDDPATCFNSARIAVRNMSSMANGYAFCYDGYATLEDGTRDAVVVERASKTDALAETFAILYSRGADEAGAPVYEKDICDLGEASSLFLAEAVPDAPGQDEGCECCGHEKDSSDDEGLAHSNTGAGQGQGGQDGQDGHTQPQGASAPGHKEHKHGDSNGAKKATG